MTIATRHSRIQAKIDRANQDLDALQAECVHSKAILTHRSNTSDGYSQCAVDIFTHHQCPDCGKHWSQLERTVAGPLQW